MMFNDPLLVALVVWSVLFGGGFVSGFIWRGRR